MNFHVYKTDNEYNQHKRQGSAKNVTYVNTIKM